NLEPAFGKEIGKIRPVFILSNNQQNLYSPLVIVLPITSSLDKIYSWEVKINLDHKQGKILTDQITAIDKERLGGKIKISDSSELLDLVEKALHKILDFKK
ncbi:6447_t:CDS:1, partial [Racocetra persica]